MRREQSTSRTSSRPRAADRASAVAAPAASHPSTSREAGCAPYFERAGLDPRHVSGHAFELLVFAWLGDVIRSEGTAEKFAGDRSWLAKSGFHIAVKDGHIEFEATA